MVGEIAFTLTLYFPHSRASCFVAWISPAFAVPYARWRSNATTPACDAILIMLPPPFFIIVFPTDTDMRTAPVKFTAMVRSQTCSVLSAAASRYPTPAQFTRTSILPNSTVAASTVSVITS